MKFKNKIILFIAALVISACASAPKEQSNFAIDTNTGQTNLVMTKDANEKIGHGTLSNSYELGEKVYAYVTMYVDKSTPPPKTLAAVWYSKGKVIAKKPFVPHFSKKMPHYTWFGIDSTELGAGEGQVDIYADNVLLKSGNFVVNDKAGFVAPPVVVLDSDNDGVPDENDFCPHTEPGKNVDMRGCPSVLISLQGINFNVDSSKIQPSSEPILIKAVNALKDVVGVSVIVEGHTDNTGSDAHNQALSERRAKTVYDYLVTHGIDATSLTTKGYGEGSPIAGNETSAGRYKNRRVDLKTVGVVYLRGEKQLSPSNDK